MRYTPLVFLSFIFLLSAKCKKAENTNIKLILQSDFESTTDPFAGWTNNQHCCDYSLPQSHQQFSEGNNSLRLEVRSTDPLTSGYIRSELVQPVDDLGTEHWYGFN